jgi:hypothetical protein
MKHNNTSRLVKGAGFTGNQLFHLFASQYGLLRKDGTVIQPAPNKKDGIRIDANEAMNVVPLNKKNDQLFNPRFQVYLDPELMRFIVIHEGTVGTFYDWGNNLRNIFITTKRKSMTRTKRFQFAKEGHAELKKYLVRLYNDRDRRMLDKNQHKIVALIQELMDGKDTQIQEITKEEAVEQLLKQRMSVIGHSQGAVYAYLFGNEGFETVVYNPAPFRGKKPDNTYIIRRTGDIVSKFTTRDDPNAHYTKLDKVRHQKDPFYQHYITPLENNYTVFGNKFQYSKDKKLDQELQKIQDRRKSLSVKRTNSKQDRRKSLSVKRTDSKQDRPDSKQDRPKSLSDTPEPFTQIKANEIQDKLVESYESRELHKSHSSDNLSIDGGKRKTRRYKRRK